MPFSMGWRIGVNIMVGKLNVLLPAGAWVVHARIRVLSAGSWPLGKRTPLALCTHVAQFIWTLTSWIRMFLMHWC